MPKDCKTVWNNCLQYIAQEVGGQSFKTWFQPIVPMKLVGQTLTVQVPSPFFYEWLEEHFVGVLRRAIDRELGPAGRLEYSIVVDKGKAPKGPGVMNLPTSKVPAHGAQKNQPVQRVPKKAPTQVPSAGDKQSNPFTIGRHDRRSFDSQLNPKYVFETFVEGESNRLARSAGLSIAKNPKSSAFNPLMVYGGVGLGKTHLVQAIGNKVKEQHPDKVVLYVSSEKFANQAVEAFKNRSVQAFGQFYLQVDVLIVDDIQFLAGKEKTQEVFFHIFNHLHQNGKQIIVTSDCSPKELQGMHERLVSRFKWGLTADLQEPDYNMRTNIIVKKLQADGFSLEQTVVDYVARTVQTNIRELEGVLVSLIANASLNRSEVDLNVAKTTLQHIVKNIEEDIDISFIEKQISDYFGVPLEAIHDKTRKRNVVIARQVAMYLTKEYTRLSLKAIGRHFGNRDHSTVSHAVGAVNKLMDKDPSFSRTVDELQAMFRKQAG